MSFYRILKLFLNTFLQFGGAENTYYDMDESSPEYNSYCDSHFLKKAIVGTLQADSLSMGSFPSASTANWPGYSQVCECTISFHIRKYLLNTVGEI